MMVFAGRIIVLFLMIFVLDGCEKSKMQRGGNGAGKKISIVTTLFPLYDFTRNICGDRMDVRLLLPPGVEAHSFEPKPADLVTISRADVFIYTSAAMEPWAAKLLKGVASSSLLVVDASVNTLQIRAEAAERHTTGERDHGNHGGMDPHLWLDFNNAQTMVDTIAGAVIARDPLHEEFYRVNARRFKEELLKLDDDFKRGLAGCEKRTFLHGGHYTFGYLAARYGLEYQSAQAVNPDAEPTPSTIAHLMKLISSSGLDYVYSEELVSPRIAEMLARETGVKILMLHGAHNISRDDLAGGTTFIGLMRKNLANLQTGLRCGASPTDISVTRPGR